MPMQTIRSAGKSFVKLFAAYKPEAEEEVQYDFSTSDLGQPEYSKVASKAALPSVGNSNIIYQTLDDHNLWTWSRNAYTEYNPYGFGVSTEYREPVQTVVKSTRRVVDVDDTLLIIEDIRQMCSISIDAVKEGADARLAMAYNIDALRADLAMIRDLKMSYASMIPVGKQMPYHRGTPAQVLVDNWFFHNHSALSLLLRSSCRSATHMDNNMLDGIAIKKAHLWWDSVAGNAKFKDGDFEVNL